MRLALLAVSILGACIGTTPEERERAGLGPGDDGDAEHRPGQPCLVCHDELAIAGTVYLTADDPDDAGLEGARVVLVDADGAEEEAVTNRAGNFMIERRRWQPRFPVSVAVIHDGEEKAMETLIWREGSCAGCHRSSRAGADFVEKVWATEATP